MNKNIISITKKAFEKMNLIMKSSGNSNGFLFSVTSGGCNGFNFNLKLMNNDDLDNIINSKPTIIKDNRVDVYIDPVSEIYLFGTTIDYIKEDYSKGVFDSKFTYNIDRKFASSCGCGVSFTPRIK